MKRTIKCFISLIMVLSVVSSIFIPSAFASIDLDKIRDNQTVTMDIDDDGDAYVSSIIGKTNITHEDALEDYPSYIFSDIIIIDYYSSSPGTAWRLWVNYSAEKYLGITSITITFNGKNYTFSDVGDKKNMTDYGTNVREAACMIMGTGNMSFWGDVLTVFEDLETKTDMLDMSATAVLHGSKNVEITIPGSALLDFAIVGETYLGAEDFETITKEEGTAMVTE